MLLLALILVGCGQDPSIPAITLQWFAAEQAYLREHQPPALIVWGPHDGYMPEQSARAYHRDLPDAPLHVLGGGYWLLETHLDEVGPLADGQTLVNNTDGDFSPEKYFEPVDPTNPELGYKPSILDSTGLVNNGVNEPVAERVLAQILGDMLPPGADPTIAMKNQYDDTIANPDPNPAKEPGR